MIVADALRCQMTINILSLYIDVLYIIDSTKNVTSHRLTRNALMITAAQLRAARALLNIDQKTMAEMAGVSLPTIQRMEASLGNVRGIVDSLTKVIEALNRAGVELLSEHTHNDGGGRGVRFRRAEAPSGKPN